METLVEVGSVAKCEGENNDCLSIELTSSAVLSQSKNDASFSSACNNMSFVSDVSLAVDESDDDEIFTEMQLQRGLWKHRVWTQVRVGVRVKLRVKISGIFQAPPILVFPQDTCAATD